MIGRVLVMLVAALGMLAIPMADDAEAHGRGNVRVNVRAPVRTPIRSALGFGGGRSFVGVNVGYSRANVGFSRSYVQPIAFQKSYAYRAPIQFQQSYYRAPIAFQQSYAYVAPQVASYAYAAPVQYNHAPPIQCVTTPCVQPVQYQTGCSAYFAAPVAYSSVGYSTGGGCASLFGY